MSDSKASEVRRVCGCAVAGVCRVFAAETRCARDCLQPLRRRDPRPPPPLHLVACWGVSAAVPCGHLLTPCAVRLCVAAVDGCGCDGRLASTGTLSVRVREGNAGEVSALCPSSMHSCPLHCLRCTQC